MLNSAWPVALSLEAAIDGILLDPPMLNINSIQFNIKGILKNLFCEGNWAYCERQKAEHIVKEKNSL